jgi:hypothetical protein
MRSILSWTLFQEGGALRQDDPSQFLAIHIRHSGIDVGRKDE